MKNNLSRVGRARSLMDVYRYGGSFDTFDYENLTPADPFSGLPEKPLVYGDQRVENLYNAMKPVRCERAINSQTYMNNSSADYVGGYDVSEMFFNVTPGNYKIYLGQHNTVNPSYINDWTVGAIQILNAAGDVIHAITADAALPSGDKWDSASLQYTTAFDSTTIQSLIGEVSGTFTDVGTALSTLRWSYASSTGSGYTGAANGINTSNIDNVPLTVGPATAAQQILGSKTFLYRETSGSTLETGVLGRTKNTYAIPAFGSIRIAYTLCVPTADINDIDIHDSLYLGFY